MWVYPLPQGWVAYAGKTDADNDLLSCSFARKTDYWFHAHAVPGSHVILRGPENCAPDRMLLELAAGIAAWHSKARHSGSCNVDCTLAVNVSKPPGAPPGTVSLSRSRLLKVKPGLWVDSAAPELF